ncbi:MAG: ATP synthase F0 subunit B, partial [Patescibacteria group bacterium]
MFIETVYASEEAAEAAGQVSEGLLASLGINLPLFIFQLINFAIVAVILWFLILKPLTKKLAERQKMIDDSISNAER